MMKERLGFKCDEGLIIKYPETVLTAKVTIQKDNKYVAELINYSQLREIIENNNKEKPIKKKLISSMIVFYILLVCVIHLYYSASFMANFIFLTCSVSSLFFFSFSTFCKHNNYTIFSEFCLIMKIPIIISGILRTFPNP